MTQSVHVDVEKILKEWDDPDSDGLFILDDNEEFKEFEEYTDQDWSVYLSIKNGSLAEALEDRYSTVKEEEALLEDHLPEEVILGNNSTDIFLDKFLLVLTLWGGVAVLAFGAAVIYLKVLEWFN